MLQLVRGVVRDHCPTKVGIQLPDKPERNKDVDVYCWFYFQRTLLEEFCKRAVQVLSYKGDAIITAGNTALW